MRIWVARAEPAASRTAESLRALGHDPLVAPVTILAPTLTAPPQGPFDAILLTSANAARAIADTGLPYSPVFAVGDRTAAAARAVSLRDVVAADGTARDLAALVGATLPPGSTLLHVAGEDRKPEPERTLRAAGFQLTVWTAYAARAVEDLPPAVRASLAGDAAALDAALHYSRRSAELALRLALDAGLGAGFARLRHLCLSVDVAAPLVEAGIGTHFVAARPDEESLLLGLVEAP